MFKIPFYGLLLKDKTKWFYLLTILNILLNLLVIIFLDSENGKIEETVNKLSFFEQILLIGFIGPLLEEFLFRYPLFKNKINIDFIFFLTIPVSFNMIFYKKFTISTLNIFYFIIIYIALFFLFRKKLFLSLLKNFDKYFIFIFYGLSLLFACIHIYNYSDKSIISTIVLVFLTFLSSLFFSFIRISIGFRYSIFSHILYNCFFLLINLIQNYVQTH